MLELLFQTKLTLYIEDSIKIYSHSNAMRNGNTPYGELGMAKETSSMTKLIYLGLSLWNLRRDLSGTSQFFRQKLFDCQGTCPIPAMTFDKRCF